MGFSIVAFSELVTASATAEKLTAVPDDHIKTEGDGIIIPEYNKLLGVLGIGLNIRNVQLATPSLRAMALYDVAPVENEALPSLNPYPLITGESFLELREDETLNAYAGESAGANTQESVIVFLSDDNISSVTGRMYTIKATATAPATAYAWASASLTLSQSLPNGTYALVGARCEQAHTIAYRFIFIGGIWRPGHISVVNINAFDHPYSRRGGLGVWGEFTHNKTPSIEFFGDGTGGTAVVYLDLVKVS